MVTLTIDGRTVSTSEKTTILEAADQAGISIPHLCYLKDLNEIGACRLCCVQVEGEEKLISACNNVVKDGMVIYTDNARVRTARRTNLELILSQHDCRCAMCTRSGSCQFQKLANDMGILESRFQQELSTWKQCQWNAGFPLIRDNAKCIKCMRCVQVCDKIQGLHIWEMTSTGSRTQVNVSGNRSIEEMDCSLCGQCIVHCPVGALRERDDTQVVMRALLDPEIVTVVQIAPAVRTSWGEAFGLLPEQATVNKLAGIMRAIGFDYVFDTSYSADLTIMEEGSELLCRLNSSERKRLPMFTSCCPGWVRFVKSQYSELADHLSTAKSPQQMFGAVIKQYFAGKKGIQPDKICCVSLMPCVAKKAECELPVMHSADGIQDVDVVLTTREVVRLIRSRNIMIESVGDTDFDHLLGTYSGAGVIFGRTGGVMDAALRTAYYLSTGTNPSPDAFRTIRDTDKNGSVHPWQEAEFYIGDRRLKVAAVSGLGNARILCEELLRENIHYDFVEVMACPGGCAGGGGQPLHCDDLERAGKRGEILDQIDRNISIRFSHENEDVAKLYHDALEHPLSQKAEAMLHTDHVEQTAL